MCNYSLYRLRTASKSSYMSSSTRPLVPCPKSPPLSGIQPYKQGQRRVQAERPPPPSFPLLHDSPVTSLPPAARPRRPPPHPIASTRSRKSSTSNDERECPRKHGGGREAKKGWREAKRRGKKDGWRAARTREREREEAASAREREREGGQQAHERERGGGQQAHEGQHARGRERGGGAASARDGNTMERHNSRQVASKESQLT